MEGAKWKVRSGRWGVEGEKWKVRSGGERGARGGTAAYHLEQHVQLGHPLHVLDADLDVLIHRLLGEVELQTRGTHTHRMGVCVRAWAWASAWAWAWDAHGTSIA